MFAIALPLLRSNLLAPLISHKTVCPTLKEIYESCTSSTIHHRKELRRLTLRNSLTSKLVRKNQMGCSRMVGACVLRHQRCDGQIKLSNEADRTGSANDLTALGHYDVQMRWIKRITGQSRCSSHTAYKLGISCARPLKYKNLYGKRLEQYAGISWEFREPVQNLDVSRQKRKRRGLDGVNRINGRCVHSFICLLWRFPVTLFPPVRWFPKLITKNRRREGLQV